MSNWFINAVNEKFTDNGKLDVDYIIHLADIYVRNNRQCNSALVGGKHFPPQSIAYVSAMCLREALRDALDPPQAIQWHQVLEWLLSRPVVEQAKLSALLKAMVCRERANALADGAILAKWGTFALDLEHKALAKKWLKALLETTSDFFREQEPEDESEAMFFVIRPMGGMYSDVVQAVLATDKMLLAAVREHLKHVMLGEIMFELTWAVADRLDNYATQLGHGEVTAELWEEWREMVLADLPEDYRIPGYVLDQWEDEKNIIAHICEQVAFAREELLQDEWRKVAETQLRIHLLSLAGVLDKDRYVDTSNRINMALGNI